MYWKVKLTRTQARRGKVPFSLFYLFPREDFDAFRDVFETFIGFPARQSQIRWEDVMVDEVNDEEVEASLLEILPDVTDIKANLHVAVPILSLNAFSGVRSSMFLDMTQAVERPTAMDLKGILDLYKQVQDSAAKPAFLTTEAWKNWRATQRGPRAWNRAFPPVSYFVTRDEIYIPPCIACPRIGYHEAGECYLGDAVCYDALRKYDASATMFNRLREFDELQESIDVLPDHESAGSSTPQPSSEAEDQTD